MQPQENNQEFDDAFAQALSSSSEDGGYVPESEEETGETDTGEGETGETEAGEGETGTGEGETDETDTGEGETGEGETGETETGGTGETGGSGEGGTGESGTGESGTGEAAGGERGAGERRYTEEELQQIANRIQQSGQQQTGQQSGAQGEGESGEGEGEQQPTSWMDYVPEDKRPMVQQYESEWPEVAEAEQLKRDAQLQHMRDSIYSEMGEALAPIAEMYQQMQVDAHQQTIRNQHPDVDDIKQDLVGWVDQQPDFVRPAFQQVLKQGSADQVNQLIDHYKQATGKTGAGAETTASSARQQSGGSEQRSNGQAQQPRQKKAPSAAAKKATAATPKPNRSQAPAASDPADFESAFEEAAGLK